MKVYGCLVFTFIFSSIKHKYEKLLFEFGLGMAKTGSGSGFGLPDSGPGH